jgi:hypothetical protein
MTEMSWLAAAQPRTTAIGGTRCDERRERGHRRRDGARPDRRVERRREQPDDGGIHAAKRPPEQSRHLQPVPERQHPNRSRNEGM